MRFRRESCRWQFHAGRVTSARRATTRGPIRQKRGLTQNSRAGNPKRCDLNCQSRADCFINATPLRRPEAVGWAPLVGKPADYLPSWTVGQWLPAPCNGGPYKRAATLEPTKREMGRHGPRVGNRKRKRPNCHKKRYSRTSEDCINKKGDPKTQCAKGKGPKDPSDRPKQDPSGWTAQRYAVLGSSSSLRQRGWHRDSWCPPAALGRRRCQTPPAGGGAKHPPAGGGPNTPGRRR